MWSLVAHVSTCLLRRLRENTPVLTASSSASLGLSLSVSSASMVGCGSSESHSVMLGVLGRCGLLQRPLDAGVGEQQHVSERDLYHWSLSGDEQSEQAVQSQSPPWR